MIQNFLPINTQIQEIPPQTKMIYISAKDLYNLLDNLHFQYLMLIIVCIIISFAFGVTISDDAFRNQILLHQAAIMHNLAANVQNIPEPIPGFE